MRFDSPEFFISLTLMAVLFNAWKNVAYQRFLLICFSLLFIFCFNWLSGSVIVAVTIVNYFLLKFLNETKDLKRKKVFYWLGIGLSISTLFVYKLIQYILAQKQEGLHSQHWTILGIGYYTLQLISYYLEVYNRRKPFPFSFSEFVLSIILFSKLPSGPILTYHQSSSLAKESYSTKQEDVVYAIQRILLGLFKKIALADRLDPYVINGYDHHVFLNGLMVYLTPFLFTLQLYFDFSAYIDIAIGSARLFGIQLPENFNLPLRATSISEFWRRWHITLVNWLTNYIYYPLSFRYRKLKKKGLVIAVALTFLVSALWHGIDITFFIWAACHFFYIIFENLTKGKWRAKLSVKWMNFIRIVWVWHLVAFSNIFFRCHHLSDVRKMLGQFKELPFLYPPELNFKTWLINGGSDIETEFNFRITLLICLLFLLLERKINMLALSEKYRITYATALIVLIALFGMFNTGAHFIYMQF